MRQKIKNLNRTCCIRTNRRKSGTRNTHMKYNDK